MKNTKYNIPKELYDELLNNPFVGICITDGKGLALAVNEIHSYISSIPKDAFIGRYMADLVAEKVLSVSSTMEVLKLRKPITIHQVVNNSISYDVSARPIFNEKGDIVYVISYLLDITTLVKSQNYIKKLQKDKEIIESKYQKLQEALGHLGNIIYQSQCMQEIICRARKIADTQASVLITGPTGSGKEVIANLLHEESNRKNASFIKINCSAIPESLLESELFGYEPGAFTGGDRKGKKGLFEHADGGTLLLDEIGEMPLFLQAKLLRVLQDQSVRRIGGSKSIQVNVRIVASTNASLKELIEQKKFREDLYYRLNVIEIKLPGLSQRKEDIPLLAEHFIQIFNTKYGYHKKLSFEALRYISSREYPGNIRELKNIIERLILQSSGEEITLKDTFEAFGLLKIQATDADTTLDIQTDDNISLKELMNQYESKILSEYVKRYANATEIAKKLQTDRTTISRKLIKYHIQE